MTLIDADSWLIGVQVVYLFYMFWYSTYIAGERKYYYQSEDGYGRIYEWYGRLLLIGRHRDRVAGILMLLCVVSTVVLRLFEINGEALAIRYVPSVIMVPLGIYIEYRVGRRTSATNPATN